MKIIRANCHKTGAIREIKIDDMDLSFVSQWEWHLNCNGYAYRQFRDETGKCVQVFLHRVLAETPDGYFTDHVNKDILDNRRENLRVVTKSQNAMNSADRKSQSGHRGIRKTLNGYSARIKINRKELHIGSFPTLALAIEARKQAANKYHGEYQPR